MREMKNEEKVWETQAKEGALPLLFHNFSISPPACRQPACPPRSGPQYCRPRRCK